MKLSLSLSLVMVSVALIGCNGGSSGSGASSSGVREEIFTDGAVTSFQQTAGVASNGSPLLNQLLGTAYAVSGNIRCVEGASVSFELDALGNTVQIDTACNSNIDLNIRRGLLESMAGKRLLMYWGGGHDTRSEGRVVTFNSAGSFWGTYENIPAGAGNTGKNEHLCKDKLTFDQATGEVTIEHDVTNSLAAGADSTQDCLNSEFVGATLADYKKVLHYRFKDGKLEMHSLTTFPQDNDINQFCIDNDSNGSCDS